MTVHRQHDSFRSIGRLLALAAALSLTACGILDPFGSGNAPAIRFTITGGFAGINQTTSIDQNGLAEMVHTAGDTTMYQLTKDQHSDLRTAFNQAAFFTLKGAYIPERRRADGFYYEITFGSKTVRVEDGADIPGKLRTLIEALHETNRLIIISS